MTRFFCAQPCAGAEWPPALSGRRHQVRRHFKPLADPLIGDATHGKGPLNRAIAGPLGLARLWLHALLLTLPHPADGRPITLRAEPGPEGGRWLPPGSAGPGGAGWRRTG